MRIASINFYVGNKQPKADLALIERLNIDSIGFQEAHRHLDLITRELNGFRVLKARRSDGQGATEVAVALNRRNEYLGHSGEEVSDLEPGEETKIMKSRWITVVRFKHKGVKYAHINYHGNAVTQSKQTGKLLKNERVREWVEAAKEIQSRIKRLQERGYKVIVTGDFNYRRMSRLERFALAYWSPQRTFKRRGLEFSEHGLDYVAWSKSLNKKRIITLHADKTGSDHPWIIVDLA